MIEPAAAPCAGTQEAVDMHRALATAFEEGGDPTQNPEVAALSAQVGRDTHA